MNNYIKYPNPMLTAQSVVKILNDKNKRFSPRPWNRFNPEYTLWWVVPSNQWPAYKFGKYMFFNDNDKIRFGINIEKGFGQTACVAYPALHKKGLALQNDWMWVKFIEDLKEDDNDKMFDSIKDIISADIHITISSGLASDPTDYDPFAPKSDAMEYEYIDGILKVTNKTHTNGILDSLDGSKDLKTLSNDLLSLEQLDWIWIDVAVTTSLKKINQMITINDKIFDSYDICGVLDCFNKWLGSNKI